MLNVSVVGTSTRMGPGPKVLVNAGGGVTRTSANGLKLRSSPAPVAVFRNEVGTATIAPVAWNVTIHIAAGARAKGGMENPLARGVTVPPGHPFTTLPPTSVRVAGKISVKVRLVNGTVVTLLMVTVKVVLVPPLIV